VGLGAAATPVTDAWKPSLSTAAASFSGVCLLSS